MRIRPFQAEDWPAICAIYDLAKPDEMRGIVAPGDIPRLHDDARMVARFGESRVIVMERSGQVLGFAGRVGNLMAWLFVHPSARWQGIAKALVRQLLADIEGPVCLNVVKRNVAALALYTSLGFTLDCEFEGDVQGHPCPAARLRHENSPPVDGGSMHSSHVGGRVNP